MAIKKAKNAFYLLRKRPFYFFLVLLDKATGQNVFAKKIDSGAKSASKALGLDVKTIHIDALSILGKNVAARKSIALTKVLDVDEFLQESGLEEYFSNERSQLLGSLLDRHQSDKSSTHGYEKIYQPIFDKIIAHQDSLKISEIGLGTNNLEFHSNMGFWGNPGASCRAFKEFDHKITVHGGDIDRSILFQEERISTSYVDQLCLDSLRNFTTSKEFDVIIDDGLHAPRANFNFLTTALETTRKKALDSKPGWIIIEDVPDTKEYYEFWSNALCLLPEEIQAWIVRTKSRLAIIVLDQ